MLESEQAARVGPLFPVTGSHALVMQVVRQFGSDALRAEIADGVRAGTVQACLGYTEPDCGSDAAAIRTRAVRDGDEWRITGQKMFSTGAHLCQYVMLTARTNPDVAKHQGITMFLVPLDGPGVEVQGIGTLGGERTNFVYLDDVRVPDRYRLGPVDQGWAIASGALAAEHGMGVGRRRTARSPQRRSPSAINATTRLAGRVAATRSTPRVERGRATTAADPTARRVHRRSLGAGAARAGRARLRGRRRSRRNPYRSR